MPTTPTTQLSPQLQRNLKALAEDWIDQHFLQPLTLGQHLDSLSTLLTNAYSLGQADANRTTLERIDEHVIDPIQKDL